MPMEAVDFAAEWRTSAFGAANPGTVDSDAHSLRASSQFRLRDINSNRGRFVKPRPQQTFRLLTPDNHRYVHRQTPKSRPRQMQRNARDFTMRSSKPRARTTQTTPVRSLEIFYDKLARESAESTAFEFPVFKTVRKGLAQYSCEVELPPCAAIKLPNGASFVSRGSRKQEAENNAAQKAYQHLQSLKEGRSDSRVKRSPGHRRAVSSLPVSTTKHRHQRSLSIEVVNNSNNSDTMSETAPSVSSPQLSRQSSEDDTHSLNNIKTLNHLVFDEEKSDMEEKHPATETAPPSFQLPPLKDDRNSDDGDQTPRTREIEAKLASLEAAVAELSCIALQYA